MSNQSPYRLLTIRCWQEDDGGKIVWRCRVKNIQTGEIFGFTSQDELLSFLSTQIDWPDANRQLKNRV